MTVPGWYELALLALASFRLWRLAAIDDILDRPRRWLLRLGDWRGPGDPVPADYRKNWGDFLECPWCATTWIAGAVYLLWQWQPKWTLVFCAWLAISAAVALIRGNLDPPE